ncbi:MAG: hypothetical protein COB50_03620 [Thiotrichales bacterium]|nr:MAG: hypothetical protein COB50_03620 [Thiotrichales bacterium]
MIYAHTITAFDTAGVIKSKLEKFLEKNNLDVGKHIVETQKNNVSFKKRRLAKILEPEANCKVLLAYEATHLVCSTNQFLDLLDIIIQRGISLYLVKPDIKFVPGKLILQKELLTLLVYASKNLTKARLLYAIEKRRKLGLHVGRPKGSMNKVNKLDKKRKTIIKYIKRQLISSAIAKLIGCHPETVRKYISDNELHKYRQQG